MRSNKVEFKAPDGVVPEGTQAGEEFDMVCSFRVKDSGQVCMTMMGDAKMPGYDEKDKRPDYREYSKGMMDARPSDEMTMTQDNQ